jgi:hypothetical protein
MPIAKRKATIMPTAYTKTNLYRGITWNAMASWNKKVRTIRNEIQLDVNQFNTPILSNNPWDELHVSGSSKKYTVLTWG